MSAESAAVKLSEIVVAITSYGLHLSAREVEEWPECVGARVLLAAEAARLAAIMAVQLPSKTETDTFMAALASFRMSGRRE